MVENMKKVAMENGTMSVEERNWFSMAYKNVIGSRRASWRIVSSIEQKEEAKGNVSNVSVVRAYRRRIEGELAGICQDIIAILNEHLIPAAEDADSRVFYNKMAGDYHRYEAEFVTGDAKRVASEASLEAYKKATAISEAELAPTHPIRLGLALNFSVFYFEIMGQPEEACSLAKRAFDDAIARLDSVSEESYKDSTLIMQLLRDNLTLWMSELEESGVPTATLQQQKQSTENEPAAPVVESKAGVDA